MLSLDNEKNLVIAYGYMTDFNSYKVEGFEQAVKRAFIGTFVEWLDDNDEEITDLEQANNRLYSYYENDDCHGFAQIFGTEAEAIEYLAEVKERTEGLMYDGVL